MNRIISVFYASHVRVLHHNQFTAWSMQTVPHCL